MFISFVSTWIFGIALKASHIVPTAKVMFYRPQTKFGKVMFLNLSVSDYVHRGGVSRPRPKGKVEVWMRGCLGPDPDPGVRLWGLAGGVQAQTRGSRPRPRDGGCPGPGPGPGEYICTEADPPSRWLLLWVVHILLECILVVKLISC